MKRTFLFILIMVLGTTFASAQDRGGDSDAKAVSPQKRSGDSDVKADSKSGGSFFIGFGSGTDLPGNNWSSNYTLGGGAQAFCGYAFDPNWAVRVDVENWFFEGSDFSLYNLRTLASLKYTFSVEGWQPYLLVGGGLVYQALSTAATTFNSDVLGGVGVQFDLTVDTRFYIEGRYNLIIPATGSYQDVPITAGIWTSL